MTHIRLMRETAAAWQSSNIVLRDGEVGWEKDTRKGKVGDGVTAYNSLPYAFLPPTAAPAAPVTSVAGKTGVVTLSKTDVGLDQVTNTSDANKPVSTPQANTLAPIASPTFTGSPKAPTPLTSDNSTLLATTAFTKAAIAASLASPTFTGDPKAPTPSTADNDTSIATTAFVKAAILAADPYQRGVVVISLNATGSGTATIALNPAIFGGTTPGHVQTTTLNGSSYFSGCSARGANSITVFVRHFDNTAGSANISVAWTAYKNDAINSG